MYLKFNFHIKYIFYLTTLWSVLVFHGFNNQIFAQNNTPDPDYQKIIQQSKAGTVYVKSNLRRGTGFIFKKVNNLYYVATSANLLFPSEFSKSFDSNFQPTVVVSSGGPDEREFAAELIAHSNREDIAILKFKSKDAQLTVLSFPDAYTYEETTPIIAVGFPFADALAESGNPAPTFNLGTISSLRHDRKTNILDSIQLDTNLNPGNSGGPILTRQGQVIGIAASSLLGTDISFAIPLPTIQKVLHGSLGDCRLMKSKEIFPDWVELELELNLLDPFQRIEDVSLTLLSRPPTQDESVAPYSAIPGNTIKINIDRRPAIFTAKKTVSYSKPNLYQFSIKRKGSKQREYFAPVFFKGIFADSGGPVTLYSPPPKSKKELEKERVPARLPDALQPQAIQVFDQSWVPQLKSRIKEPQTLKFPDTPTQFFAVGGGRFLLFFFPKINSLGVLDLGQLKFTKFFHYRDPFIFAAGGYNLLIYHPGTSQFETIHLPTLETITSGEVKLRGIPKALIMGSDHSRRAIVFAYDQADKKGFFDLVDAETYEALPLSLSLLNQDSFPKGTWVNENASAFVSWNKRFVFTDTDQLREIRGREVGRAQWIYQSFFVSDVRLFEVDSFEPIELLGGQCFTSRTGRLYLKLHTQSPHNLAQLSVHAFGDNQRVLQMGLELDRFREIRDESNKNGIPLFHFSEEAEYLALIDGYHNEFKIQSLSIENHWKELGCDYFFLGSRPHLNVARDQGFSYQILSVTNAKDLSFRLLTKPDGMTISKTGLVTWKPSKDQKDGDHLVEIQIIGGKTVASSQTFTLKLK